MAAILDTVESPPLAAIVAETLADEPLMAALARSPAGVKQHHAYAGGLLEHVVSLLRIADRVAPLYAYLDRDLLLVGVLFHYLGKTVELESERGFSYTDAGQLLGHVLLGLEIVDDKIRVVLDGKPVGYLKSSGIAHATKSRFEFGVAGQADGHSGQFDDLKIYSASAK